MTTPTDLLKRSREKYALGQARLRREASELALLSFQGSLEDALRANLLLHALPAAQGDWEAVLTTLRSSSGDPSLGPPLLITGEAERLRRMQSLRDRISSGGQVTVSLDTISDYQQFAGRLLQRYGVLVGQPDDGSPAPYSRLSRETPPDNRRKLVDRLPAFVIPALLVLLMLAAGAAAAVMIQGGQAPTVRPTAAAAVPTMPDAVVIPPLTPGAPMPSVTPIPSPTTAPPGALALGRTAYVRSDVVGGLALREQPGVAASNIIRVYLDPGTAVTVIGGPSEADGYQWWLVRAANIDGWCAGEFLEVR
jgi:hypothetical protein